MLLRKKCLLFLKLVILLHVDKYQNIAKWILLADTVQRRSQIHQECDKCQRTRNLTARSEMPMNYILEVEIFDVWGIDYMELFPPSFGNSYILLVVDYISKWIEAVELPLMMPKW